MLVLAREFEDIEIREEMVKLATQSECEIETVSENDALIKFGGVGCLLRYFSAENSA